MLAPPIGQSIPPHPTHPHPTPTHPTATNQQDPGVQAAFQELLRRHPDVDAVLLSTNDGVPLLRGTRPPPMQGLY